MDEAIPYKGLVVSLFGFEEFEVQTSGSICWIVVQTLVFKKSILTEETSTLEKEFLLQIHMTNKDNCLLITSWHLS